MRKKDIKDTPDAPGVITLRLPLKADKDLKLSKLYSTKTQKLFVPFAKLLTQGTLTVSSDSATRLMQTCAEMEKRSTFDKISKDRLEVLYYSFAANLHNFLSVAQADVRYAKAWDILINNPEVSSEMLASILGRDIQAEDYYEWYGSSVIPEVLFAHLSVPAFGKTYNHRTREYGIRASFSLPTPKRKALSDLFFGPEYASPHLFDSLPDDKPLTIENFEAQTVVDIMTLDGISLNGSMLSANGSISMSQVKKVRTQTSIPDFKGPVREWGVDRLEMLCLTYFSLWERIGKNNKIDITNLARFAAEDMPRCIVGPIFNTFLPMWQGFAKSWTSESYTYHIAHAISNILHNAADSWLSLDNFRMMLMCEDGEEPVWRMLKLFTYRGREKASPVNKAEKEDKGKRPVIHRAFNWIEDFGMKFAVHWLKYLCALGIVELAVDDSADDDEDYLEGMRFVRLTNLGRYIFKFDKSYTAPTVDAGSSFDFDSSNGIITIDQNSPLVMFLSNISKKISPTRYHISFESLIKGCVSKGDLISRIDNLKSVIDPLKEPAIQKIIDEAMRHTDCATREGGYSMLRLRPDLPGLRDAILSNKELRDMTILAGPNIALVKTTKLARFHAICASYGYLME